MTKGSEGPIHDTKRNARDKASDGGETSMKIIADRDLCSGHARCAAVAPEIFTLNDDGYIDFDEKSVPSDQAIAARRGVRACPEKALSLDEEQA